jgi:hypothetical protein
VRSRRWSGEKLEFIRHTSSRHATYPAVDMAADAFPFFLDFGAADERGGGPDTDSADSTFDRLIRRVDEDSVASGAADGCSGLASRADAFRFLDEDFGGGGVGMVGACWLGSEVDEPAESLAAERVTLEDMRLRLDKWVHGRAVVLREGAYKCDCGVWGWMEVWGCSCGSCGGRVLCAFC